VILAFLAVVRFRRQRPDLFWLTLLQGLSIPLQAVIGGFSVLTGLNPYVVGLHFVVSIGLMIVTTMLVWRVYTGPRGTERTVPTWYLIVGHLASFAVAVTVVVGILTTGSGPHAGDNSNPDKPAPRTGFDPEFMQHLHSWPAYVTVALTLVLVIAAFVYRLPRLWQLVLLAVEGAQIVVGLVQARLGLPELLVGVHMVLAGLLVAAMTAVLLSFRRGSTVPADTAAG
jgi:cytochrome c oxidase assembly protein subunit 15